MASALVDLRTTPSPGRRRRCGGRWPTPRSATTSTARTRRSTRCRRRSPSGSARRRRCSCRRGRWPTSSRCGCWPRPGTTVIAGARQHVVIYENGAGGRNAGVQFHAVDDERRHPDPDDVALGRRGRRPPLPAGRAWCASRTPTCPPTARRGRWTRLRAVAAAAAACRCTWTAPGCSTPRWRPASPAADYARRVDDGDVLPVEGPGRARRLGAGRAGRRDRRGAAASASGWAAACARRASSPPPAWSRCETMVDRLADDHARARRLAEAVAERWPDAGRRPGRASATNVVTLRPRRRRRRSSTTSARGRAGRHDRPGRGAARDPPRRRRRRRRAGPQGDRRRTV